MSTLELQQSVLRDISALLDDTSAMEYLHEVLSRLKRARGVEDTEQEDVVEAVREDALPYPIPGLAYTHEERMEAVRQAEEDIAAGRVYTVDEATNWIRANSRYYGSKTD